MFQRLNSFLRESRQELQHVNWPTRKETIRMVIIVITISAATAIFLGAMDYIFLTSLGHLIGQ